MKRTDMMLENLKREMSDAQRDIDNAKATLDRLGGRKKAISDQIDSIKYQMDACANNIRRERDAQQACYRARDHYYINVHKMNAESYRNEMQRLKSIKQSYINDLHSFRGEWDSAVGRLREAKNRKNRARNAFTARLEELKRRNYR